MKSRIKEVERAMEITLDDETREGIHSLEELLEAIADKDLLLLEIKSFIVERMGVEPEEVTITSNFTNDLGADSLDSVELIMEAERKYGISIPDEKTTSIATVFDLCNVVLEIMKSLSSSGGASPKAD